MYLFYVSFAGLGLVTAGLEYSTACTSQNNSVLAKEWRYHVGGKVTVGMVENTGSHYR